MIDQNWIFLGAALNLVGCGTYVYSVVKGRTRPNRVTWLIIGLAPMLAFASMLFQGVSIQQSTLTFVAGLSPLIVFVSTFFAKEPVWKIEKFDLICGGLSVLGLILWLITQKGDLAILLGILADGLAFLPTLVKAFRYPETESVTLFWMGIVNGIIALIIITKWDFTHVAFPIYLLIADALAVLFIQFRFGLIFMKGDTKKVRN